VSIFRRRKDGDAQPEETPEASATAPTDAAPSSAPAGGSRPGRESGPWDVEEVEDPAAGGRVDLGGMWLPGREGVELRIEADQATSRVIAVTMVLGESALQVQPFAAPRTDPIWDEVRAEIGAGVTRQGGTADEVDGPLGTELRTKVPVRRSDGTSAVQPARFVGVDGPRWFLRGVITGRAAVEPDTDADVVALFRDVVVVRGGAPMAPRDPIPLELPAATVSGAAAEDATSADGGEDLKPFERGPEITEIR
jgi:hypothetical protein